MISPDLVSEALVAILRADPDLVLALPGGANGIREEEWRGTAFQYPIVRVVRPDLRPWGNGNCTPDQSRARLAVHAFSKKDSSVNVQMIQGLIAFALEGERLNTVDLTTLPLRRESAEPAMPDNVFDENDRWRGEVHFLTVVFPK